MPTGFALTPALHSLAPSDATGAVYAGAVLMITPMLAAMGDIPTLTKLGHWVALFLGVVMLTYGAAALSYKGAALDRVKRRLGARYVAPHIAHSAGKRR